MESTSPRRHVVLVAAIALLATLLPQWPAPAQTTEDPGLDLVFLVDGSGSIDAADWEIQKTGIANALQDRVSFPVDGTVKVSVVQWGSSVDVEVPATVLDSAAALDSVTTTVRGMVQNGGGTSPHLGIDAGVAQLDGAADPDSQQVLCMSTDGSPSSTSALSSSASNAQSSGVDRYSVLAIEDPGFFSAADARNFYGPVVFGGGTVVTARNAAEFATLVTGSCLGAPVELVGLEVNQGVQDWGNTVPLVTDKSTIVRAHVQSLDTDPVRAVGRLYGTRGGVELPSSPLLPLNSGGAVLAGPDAVSQRADMDASLNFALPPAWRSGDVELRLELVGGGVVCSETAPPADTCSAEVGFTPVATPRVRMVEVIYTDAAGDDQTVSFAERDEQAARLESALPIASVDHTNAELSRVFVDPEDEDGRDDFLGDVNESLLTARSNDGINDLYLGVLQGSIPDAGGGLAAGIQANAASWFMAGTEDVDAFGYARNRGPHEMGHAIGERHAADDTGTTYCSDNSAGGGAEVYPFAETIGGTDVPALGPLGDAETEAWGVDPRFVLAGDDDLGVIDPNQTFALMGYCNSFDNTSQGRWTDSFYWPRFIDDVNAVDWTEGPVPDGGGLWGWFRGLFDLEGPADVDFKPFLLSRPGVVPIGLPAGDHTLELRGADGEVLVSVPFEPVVMEGDATEDGDEPAGKAAFVIPIPDPPEFTTAVVLDGDGQQVGSVAASPNAPTVAITAPATGDTFAGDTVAVAWEASDPNGDPLAHTVQYSVDDGATWTTVAVDLAETTLDLPRAELAGSSRARVRVVTSDGTRASFADSGTFSVATNAPGVSIRSPFDGQAFSGVQSVFLRAVATDAEDGPLDGSAVTWSSDRDGVLGSGEEVVVLASDLTEGRHVVTATATDSSGAASSATVTIDIARVAEPPVVDDPTLLLGALVDDVAASGVADGLQRSLAAKLVGALTKVEEDQVQPACGKLGAFDNEVRAQDGSGLTSAAAADWLARSARIQGLLGC
ncbi:DUF1194 domain-containing protein [Salsipaludibacter albus]|uniref:DUF1194 domain-containing protein n=1 Tax=Salsipaludibacter albus TaxID=2849650 RepID=UPI001EE3A9EC|nr:DUF1194 domain-containing protein [Salsipaludibacter albus]MBY5164117.1 DUF1194 domain-containing protein [Salsipaludibacter albus]